MSLALYEVEFGYNYVEMKYHSLDCHLYSLAKYEKAAPVTIMMFDQVKLTTSTKVSSLHLNYRRFLPHSNGIQETV